MGLTDQFPNLAEYIDVLPDGLASYPDCRAKGSFLRSSLAGHDPNIFLPGLPPVLQDLVREPPAAGLWASAVHVDAIFHALTDKFYQSDAAIIAWTKRRTELQAASPLYRALFRVSGPRAFYSVSAMTHRLFQRGTDIENKVLERGRVVTRQTFPPHLHTRRNLICNIGLYQGVTSLAGGKNVEARLIEFSPTDALFECTWTSPQ